jgi:hypothetical protein
MHGLVLEHGFDGRNNELWHTVLVIKTERRMALNAWMEFYILSYVVSEWDLR